MLGLRTFCSQLAHPKFLGEVQLGQTFCSALWCPWWWKQPCLQNCHPFLHQLHSQHQPAQRQRRGNDVVRKRPSSASIIGPADGQPGDGDDADQDGGGGEGEEEEEEESSDHPQQVMKKPAARGGQLPPPPSPHPRRTNRNTNRKSICFGFVWNLDCLWERAQGRISGAWWESDGLCLCRWTQEKPIKAEGLWQVLGPVHTRVPEAL